MHFLPLLLPAQWQDMGQQQNVQDAAGMTRERSGAYDMSQRTLKHAARQRTLPCDGSGKSPVPAGGASRGDRDSVKSRAIHRGRQVRLPAMKPEMGHEEG